MSGFRDVGPAFPDRGRASKYTGVLKIKISCCWMIFDEFYNVTKKDRRRNCLGYVEKKFFWVVKFPPHLMFNPILVKHSSWKLDNGWSEHMRLGTWDMRPVFRPTFCYLLSLSLSLSDHWMDKEQKPGTNVQSNFRARAEKSDSPDVRWYKMFNTLWNLFENTLRYFDPTAWRTGSRFFFNYLCFMSPPPSSRDNKREEILNIQSSEMKMEKLN